MVPSSLYRALVPDAPRFMRTEGDVHAGARFAARSRNAPFLRTARPKPGLQAPSLISSHRGMIKRLLFAFPRWAIDDPKYEQAYRSVLSAMRPDTEFVVAHHRSTRQRIEAWFDAAGHASANVTYAPLPDHVNLTDWAEDAYVSLTDASDGTHYLMEPWEFHRAGDALIADAVEEYGDVRAAQAPLIFQGGNCLISDGVWLLGKDYFSDSMDLLERPRPPIAVPEDADPVTFVTQLFSQYVDGGRRLLLVGTGRPIALKELAGSRDGGKFFLDVAGGGVGTFQPIFHIDMFLSLAGPDEDGKRQILVGSPALADELLGTASPFALQSVYDAIARALSREDFKVIRNPLVHHPTLGQVLTLRDLRDLAQRQGNEALGPAIDDLVAAGAKDPDRVTIRQWHHITWNNCLVEDSQQHGRHVYLPTFGHGGHANLSKVDDHMSELWKSLGFETHMLGDFNPFAERQGVVRSTFVAANDG